MDSLEMEMINISFPDSINARNSPAIKGAPSFKTAVNTSSGGIISSPKSTAMNKADIEKPRIMAEMIKTNIQYFRMY